MRLVNFVSPLGMLVFTLLAAVEIGCGGSSAPPPPISVTISPATPQTVVENTSVTFTATRQMVDPRQLGIYTAADNILPLPKLSGTGYYF